MECSIRIPPPIAERFARGENLKVLIYCAPEPAPPFAKVDIAFPAQIELKVNGLEVKANLRGLKQRPGSTRPADITELVHRRSSQENTLTVTYALTSKVRIPLPTTV
jgi:E3 SUMO-protein ligase PIAS1